MFRAICKFRIDALIQSNISTTCRNFAASKPPKPRETLNHRLFPDKPWILFIRHVRGRANEVSGEERKALSKQWKELPEDEKQMFNFESRKLWLQKLDQFSKRPEEERKIILKAEQQILDASKAYHAASFFSV